MNEAPIPPTKPDNTGYGVHTTLDFVEGGVRERQPGRGKKPGHQTRIDPPMLHPAKSGLRYQLHPWSLGRLESLARSRFVIAEFTEAHLESWRSRDQEHYEGIVQSVMASSAIEGEKVYVTSAAVHGHVENEPEDIPASTEATRRRLIGGDIYDAYIFALQRKTAPVLTKTFILELHRMMFLRVYPEEAGKLKTSPVTIQGGSYFIETVLPERADAFLDSLLERFEQRWCLAVSANEYSLFLIITEFIVDFLAIHPFQDGNGRTARLLSTYLLERAGYHFARFYSLDNVIHETRREYYSSLYAAQSQWYLPEENLSEWVDYYISSVHTQYRRALDELREKSVIEKRFPA